MNLLKTEPVALQGMLQTTLALLVTFGLKLSAEQVGALLALTAAVLAVVTRTQVSPVVTGPLPKFPSDRP